LNVLRLQVRNAPLHVLCKRAVQTAQVYQHRTADFRLADATAALAAQQHAPLRPTRTL